MSDLREKLERARDAAPASTTDVEGLRRRGERKAVRQKIVTMSVALVVGLGAIGGGFFALARGGGSTKAAGEGAVLLTPSVDLSLGAGEYYYMRYSSPGWSFQTWWATDDSGRFAKLGGDRDETFEPGRFSSDTGPKSYLSTDPVELDEQLRERVNPGGASPEPYADWGGPIEWGLIRSIYELLTAPDVTPEQKAALVQVAAGLDGVDVTGGQLDPLGRPAILVSSNTEHRDNLWYFDPASLQLLAVGDSEIIESAGIASSTDSQELERAFVPEAGG